MSSLFKTSLVALFCLALTACGFHAMYGDNAAENANSVLAGNMTVDPIGGRLGQILKIALEDRFNPEGIKSIAPEYHLEVVLHRALIPAVVNSDGTIQRYDIRFDSEFRLRHTGDNKVVYEGTLRRTGSYNIATNANFATYEAEQDVNERTLKEIAEDYVLRLSDFVPKKQ